MANLIIGIALLFFFGHALNWFFYRTKVPDLLILIIIGYILGPVLGALNSSDFGKMGDILSTVALVVILYEGGLKLSARSLASSSLLSAKLSFLGFISIAVLGFFISYVIAGQSLPISLLLGVSIGSTSSAIVIPMVQPLLIKDSTKTLLSLESAFTDVLTIVLFLVFLESASTQRFNVNDLLVGVGPNTVSALTMGLFSGSLWAFIKRRFSHLVKMAFAGEAWALFTYGVIELSGNSGAIGVLALGFILSNLHLLPHWLNQWMNHDPISEQEKSNLKEVSFLLRTFFFIYLGLLVQFSNLKTFLISLLLVCCIFLTRFLVIRFILKTKDLTLKEALSVTAMGPRGLACAVLATLPLKSGISGGKWLQDVLFSLIPISILMTAFFIILIESSSFRKKLKPLFPFNKEEEDTF